MPFKKSEEPEEPTPIDLAASYLNEPKPPKHVHDWTEYPSGKRKCKPCGAIERPERDE